MEFDITSTIIGIVCLALFIMPFWLASRSQSRKTKMISNALNALAKSHDLKLNQLESWGGGYGLGLDQKQSKLLYVRLSKGVLKDQELVSLEEVKRCEKVNKYRLDNDVKVFEKLALVFKHKTGLGSDVNLVFFSSADGRLTLNGELQVLDKWHELIQNILKQK